MGYYIEKKINLSAPLNKVWSTYRDQLVEIGKIMPAVENIVVIERKEKDHIVQIENCWNINGNIPKAIKNIIPKSLLSYKDIARWDQKKMICYFEEEPFDGSKIYYCKGQNIFKKSGKETSLTIKMELTIYADKIPGIPSFLIKPLISKIEKFVTMEVAKNLEATAKLVVEFANNTN